MRLPDNARGPLELALHVVALLALGSLVWGAFRPAPPPAGRASASAEDLRDALRPWVVRPPAETLHVLLREGLTAEWRDALRALRRAGTRVAWSDGGVAPLALEAEAVVDPAGGVMVRVAGPDGSLVTLHDVLGPLDSIQLDGRGAAGRATLAAGPLSAQRGSTRATAVVPAAGDRRTVTVFGAVGWETRFVIAALEERGWEVDARLEVAPGIAVTQGRPLPLDAARHAVAIVFDSLAVIAPGRVSEYVERGGGLVLVGRQSGRALRAVMPGLVNATVQPPTASSAFASSRREVPTTLAVEPIGTLRDDAFALDARDSLATVAARRIGAGRVVYVGYRDTWRWRFEGSGDAEEAHRAWWASVVAAAATERAGRGGSVSGQGGLDSAPRVALAAVLGPALELPPARERSREWSSWILLGMVVTALLTEWWSRRLRGLA